jgi:UTP--glucose-1-phosphate uridylyltransferase
MSTQNSHKPVLKAVFPVAGLGTRFLPATKAIPKEMITVGDKPLIQHTVEEAREAGIKEFIFVTSPSKEALKRHFEMNKELEETLRARGKLDLLQKLLASNMAEGELKTTYQNEPLGLGHAVWCAKQLVGDEPFAVILPDVVVATNGRGCLGQMVDVYNRVGGNVIAVNEVPREDTNKYGVISYTRNQNNIYGINGMVEKPKPAEAPSNLSITGRYILQPEVFEYLSAFERGAGNEIQLTDSMRKLIGRQPFHGVAFEGQDYDCGSRLGFIEANLAYGLRDPEISEQVRRIVAKHTPSP